ncbi:probable methyltransferase-like protein 24 isoform X1 [Haliotis rubra]|uniref:probable methyltransferase-like protein 24 isoform X1 n=1 Tax=Haliotis rubra TaxID=36100 RepID=UPI001EE5B0DF|nr:probable methyltransferase-like protein 24 isoform X1 [Haliotis rubra]
MSRITFRRFVLVTALVILMTFIWTYRKNMKLDLDDSPRNAAVIGNPVPNSVLIKGSKGGVHTSSTKAQALNPVPAGQPMPTLQVLKTLDRRQLSQIYHNYVNSVQMSCKNMVRRGNIGDGGWNVCEDPPYGMKTPCNIYSFGINYDWSFDDAVATASGCHVHSYDPSMTKVSDHDRRSNIHFHRTGLNSTDTSNIKGWRMRTFSSIIKENNHTQAIIDLLKIDIEASEWFAFPEMLQSGSLKNVKQFCFELHIKLGNNPEPDIAKYLKGLELLRDFYNAGFRIFHTNKNMDAKYKSMFGMERTGCHEIYMVRSDTQTFD